MNGTSSQSVECYNYGAGAPGMNEAFDPSFATNLDLITWYEHLLIRCSSESPNKFLIRHGEGDEARDNEDSLPDKFASKDVRLHDDHG